MINVISKIQFYNFSYILSKYSATKTNEYKKEESELLEILQNTCDESILYKSDANLPPQSPVPSTSTDDSILTQTQKSDVSIENQATADDIKFQDINVKIKLMDYIPGTVKLDCGFSDLVKEKGSMATLTKRTFQRIRIIVKYLKSYQVVDAVVKLMKIILREEQKLGYVDRICKKSMLRICSRMMIDNHLKCYRIIVHHNDKEITRLFICDPSVTEDHPVLKSYIDQAKVKYLMTIRSRTITKKQQNVTQKIENDFVPEYDPEVNYGYCPKFLRMRIFHEFLYHIVYESNDNITPVDTEETLQAWRANDNNIDVDDLRRSIGDIYSSTICETMFIPPLVRQPPYSEGWIIFSDIIARLPLSIFLKVISINYKVPGLEEWMNDKVKRYVLFNQLPERLRIPLMHSRKFIFSIDDTSKLLCACGLLQFGPPNLLNKEMIYLYLNKKAILYNTTISPPGYYMVGDGIEYEKTYYDFDSSDVVKNYWTDLRQICFNTRLGMRKHLVDKGLFNKNIFNSINFRAALQPQTSQTAVINDIGQIPGDLRGAAGLDSSLYAHLKRNWNWTTKNKLKQYVPPNRKRKIDHSKTSKINGIPYKKMMKDKEIAISSIRGKRKLMPLKRITARVLPKIRIFKKENPKNKRHRIPFYDDVDRLALEQMNKLRVEWTTAEDNILLLCRIGFTYFYTKKLNIIVTFQTVRDIIQWKLKSSNKTSRACQRRINFMMKNNVTHKNVHLCLEEARTNDMIHKRFGPDFYNELRKRYSKSDEFAAALKIHFVDLVCLLIKYFSNLSSSGHAILLPDTISEFNNKFNTKEIEIPSGMVYTDPPSRYLIECHTIHSLIHSSMCCVRDKTSWNVQLFEIYKNYPDKMLVYAMDMAREQQLLALNKTVNKNKLGSNKFLPLATHPYHLSNAYQFHLITKITYDIFDQIRATAINVFLVDDENLKQEFQLLRESSSGLCFLLSEINHTGKFVYKMDIPKKVIILDPEKEKIDPLYERITKKFPDTFSILQRITTTHMMEPEYEKDSKVKFCLEPDRINYALAPIEKLMKFPDEYFHFFCLIINPSIEFNFKSNDQSQYCSKVCILNDPNFIDIVISILETNIETPPDISHKFNDLIDNIINKKIELDKKDIGKLNNAIKLKPVDLFSVITEIKESFADDDFETGWIKQYWRHEAGEEDDDEDEHFDFIPRINDQTMFDDDVTKNDLCEKIRRLHDYFVVNATKISVKRNDLYIDDDVLSFDDSQFEEIIENFRL